MVLTTRRFVLRHVIDNSDQTIKKSVQTHVGIEWTSQVTMEPTRVVITIVFKHPESNDPQDNELTISLRGIFTDGKISKQLNAYTHKFRSDGKRIGFQTDFEKTRIGLTEPNSKIIMEFPMEITGDFLVTEGRKITRDFSCHVPELTDVVLVAGGEKFHVNRAILSLQSHYFHELLQEESQLELNSIHPKTLQDILQILYHVPDINEHNVRNLLRWAEKFKMDVVTEQCKPFLLTEISANERQWLACSYHLRNLKTLQWKKRDFSKDSEFSDVVLKVQSKKFHVNKTILATFSSYFHSMFFGRFQESEQSEIELKGIDPEAFKSLLEVIYHSPNIHENNVEGLLELARMYDVQPATTKCERFLMGKSKIEKEEKRRLAEAYGLVKLEEALKNSAAKQDMIEPLLKRMKTDL